MTHQSSFYFHLLRISIAQILRAHGFTKCSDRALDVVTDLYLRHLESLVRTVQKNSELRNTEEPNIQDISDAFISMKVITPAKRLDAFDIDKLTSKGLEEFEDWFQSDMNSRYREIARPNIELIQERSRAKKLKDTNTKMNSLTAALGQQQQQQQQQQQHHQMAPPTPHQQPYHTPMQRKQSQINLLHMSSHPTTLQPQSPGMKSTTMTGLTNDHADEEEIDLTVDNDWIKFVIRQQLNEKPELKFKGTILVDYLPDDKRPKKRRKPNHDFLIVGPTPEKLIDHLPYIRSDDEDDSDDEYDEVVSVDEDGNELLNLRRGSRTSFKSHDVTSTKDGGEEVQQDDLDAEGLDHDLLLDDYDYYEHDGLYQGDVDLYGNQGNSNNLNLFG
ncbi:hypothetical protein CANARDRAFT_22113 [[Candida] arabinofermentans NRRL YB-2248]|uniref:Bromodomain associated domain-containing protein n=1 Tax=[Candida] arabinofermentans NRRL YB-2248 TaxID=983967 RepID=A0A1E4T378_9ASCO|nr:hypothetical protein CANARDRAFT_22113 [[Candida] arabinofermentans NRRL YB-2248]